MNNRRIARIARHDPHGQSSRAVDFFDSQRAAYDRPKVELAETHFESAHHPIRTRPPGGPTRR